MPLNHIKIKLNQTNYVLNAKGAPPLLSSSPSKKKEYIYSKMLQKGQKTSTSWGKKLVELLESRV